MYDGLKLACISVLPGFAQKVASREQSNIELKYLFL